MPGMRDTSHAGMAVQFQLAEPPPSRGTANIGYLTETAVIWHHPVGKDR